MFGLPVPSGLRCHARFGVQSAAAIVAVQPLDDLEEEAVHEGLGVGVEVVAIARAVEQDALVAQAAHQCGIDFESRIQVVVVVADLRLLLHSIASFERFVNCAVS